MVHVWLLQMYVCSASNEMPTTGNVKIVCAVIGVYLRVEEGEQFALFTYPLIGIIVLPVRYRKNSMPSLYHFTEFNLCLPT